MPDCPMNQSYAQLDVPMVSVVIPTYNRADLLDRLLAALEECDTPDSGIEVIVVDDGSVDHTAEVVSRRRQVSYYRQANAGPAAARNRGWIRARGDIVAFTDDDTVPDRRWLVDLVDWYRANPGADAVGGAIRPLRPSFLADFIQLDGVVGHGDDERGVRYLVTANAAFRRSALELVGGFDETFASPAAEDTDLSFRLRAQGVSLHTIGGALVLHDHRTTLVGLLRTSFKHGQGFEVLARSHSGISTEPTRRALTFSQWRHRYRRYRTEGSVGRYQSFLYLGLRAINLGSFSLGFLVARYAWHPRR